jgi:hypothetical protein
MEDKLRQAEIARTNAEVKLLEAEIRRTDAEADLTRANTELVNVQTANLQKE